MAPGTDFGRRCLERHQCGPLEHLHLAGCFDIREDRQAYARSVGLEPYASLETLLMDEKVDIVVCATPNDIHKDIVMRALEAGKMLCVKNLLR